MFSEQIHEVLDLLAAILCWVGFVPYISATITGQTKPAKATWIIWSILDIITTTGMYVEGSLNGLMLGSFFGSFLTAIVALRYGKPGWTSVEKFCFVGAGIGLLSWWITSEPMAGVLISLGLMLIGSLPTFEVAWKNPREEHQMVWALFSVACIAGLLATPAMTLADAAQPIVFAVIEIPITVILFWRRAQLKGKGTSHV